MNKLGDLSVLLCVSLGGISIALIHRTDAVMYIALAVLGTAIMLLYSFLLKKELTPDTAFRGAGYILSVCAVISASVSSAIAVTLVTDTGVLDKNYLPLTVTLVTIFAFCFALACQKSLPGTVTATVMFASVVLIILIFLCITQSKLSSIEIGTVNYKLIIPLIAFSICDAVYVLPLLKSRSKGVLILSTVLCFAYMSAMTFVALSVLSQGLFYEFDMPLMKLWQSTYITSFLSRYETVAVCAFFILSAVKSGLLLNKAVNVFGKTCIYLIIGLYLASAIALLILPNLVYFAAFLSIICGIVFPLLSVAKKC